MAIGQAPGNGPSKSEAIKRSKEVIKTEIQAKKEMCENANNRLDNDHSMDRDTQKSLMERVSPLKFDIAKLETELENAK